MDSKSFLICLCLVQSASLLLALFLFEFSYRSGKLRAIQWIIFLKEDKVNVFNHITQRTIALGKDKQQQQQQQTNKTN